MLKTGIIVIRCAVACLLSAVTIFTISAFSGKASRSVTITDGETTKIIRTCFTTAEQILTQAAMPLGALDKAELTLTASSGSLKVTRAFTVLVNYGNETPRQTTATAGTVKDILATLNIQLGEHDICNYKPSDLLTGDAYIDIVTVNYVTERHEETIPYTTKVEYSSELESGKQTTTAGQSGKKTVTVSKKYENGALKNTQVISEQTTVAPTAQKTVIGTKGAKTSANTACISTLTPASPIALNQNGVPLKYKKCLTFEGTAYTASSGARCSTGVKPQPGRIAVNPKVIPYGTKMYIVSADGKYNYGYAIASDTGGFARKNPYAVDLYMSTEAACRQFGRRNVKIYILE